MVSSLLTIPPYYLLRLLVALSSAAIRFNVDEGERECCLSYFNLLNSQTAARINSMFLASHFADTNINHCITASLTATYRLEDVPGGSSGEYSFSFQVSSRAQRRSLSFRVRDERFWLQSRAPSDANLASLDASRAQRELISQLEAKNKEIMREIARLRYTCVVYIPLYQACTSISSCWPILGSRMFRTFCFALCRLGCIARTTKSKEESNVPSISCRLLSKIIRNNYWNLLTRSRSSCLVGLSFSLLLSDSCIH